MITTEQRDKRVAAAQKKVESLQKVAGDRRAAAEKAQAEANRLLDVSTKKTAGAEAAEAELEYARAELAHRQSAPVQDTLPST